MDKRFWAVVAAIVLIFGGIIWANKKPADAPGTSSGNKSSAQTTNHVKGENAKNVTLVEYGDFQCPVCANYEPVVQEVFKKYEKDIKFQFRNFPLQQLHANAFAGSRAAEAASNQGKFWEMHDLLYANQTSWSSASDPLSSFEQYAKTLNIDTAKFKADFASKSVNDAINADIREGTKLKVDGTPSFFLDGTNIKNDQLMDEKTGQPTLEKFSKYIDEAIAKKNKQ